MSVRTQDVVNPYQPPSKPQKSKLANGARPASDRSRRQEQLDIDLQTDHDNRFDYLPPAPEVPSGPPISYKQPYGGEFMGQSPARSFSQRAKGQMLAQEALEDDEYWDDQDDIPPQMRRYHDVQKPAGRNGARASLKNGLSIPHNERKARHALAQRQPNLPSQDSPQSNPNPSRDLPRPSRYPADVAPLNLDLGSPFSRSNTVRESKNISESNEREWAFDRSPLQTLEVKLNDISKEEKRARVEEAEMLLRESKVGRGVRRSSREVPAGSKRSISTKDPALELNSPDSPTLDRNPSKMQRDGNRPRAQVESQKPDKRLSSGKSRQEVDHQKQTLARTPVVDGELHLPDQQKPQQQSSRKLGQAHPAHSVHRPAFSGQPEQGLSHDPINIDQAHPAHDPRPLHATGRRPVGPTLQVEQRRKRLQNEVTRPISNPDAPVAHSIPSNITRAVSLQQRQPQPLFRDDRDNSRSGPMRESNSSHKAALADATATIAPTGATAATSIKRDNSRKLQKAPPGNADRGSYSGVERPKSMEGGVTMVSASAQTPQFVPNAYGDDPKVEFYYKGMPKQVDVQRSNSQRAPEVVGLGVKDPAITEQNNSMNKPRRTSVSFKVPFDKARPDNEWKQAGTARLTLADLDLGVPSEGDQAWWEMSGSNERRRSKRSSGNVQASDANSQQAGTKIMEFRPPLYLKCGPLLRYTGMRWDRREPEPGQNHSEIGRETWRGSVMIVTHDSQSSYEEIPMLRLFSQPRDLLPPPPDQVQGDELAPEYVDPIAGLTKVSRRGQTLYVKPVDHLEEGKDLSRIENDDGIFETSPSPLDNGTQGSAAVNKRTRGRDGESLGKYKEVKGARLYADIERDVTFWRFNIEVELSDQQAHIAYRINHGPPVGFWVPAKGQAMNIMFHSCNGFSLSVNPDQFGGPDPLWRDVLNTHQTRPFHVMIGGGDQLYNDRVMVDTNQFAAWTQLRNPIEKHHAPFTDEMREELETFYLNRYSMWFSQGLFGLANSQIPMVNIYDDHDIIDGFGSYPDDFQRAPVFMGVGNVAFKYYMLFQHQSVPEETQADEPSWLLGAKPGPYIQQLSRSVFVNMGKSVAFLGLDCRTERERYSILTDDTYEIVLDRCRREIEEGETRHLLVLLGVPIAYPRMVWLENVLTSKAMSPLKALGRAGILKSGFLNRFDGGVEVLDDLDDHWTASGHKEERNLLIQDLQDLAAEKSVRITILGGDVHLGAVGQFYSNPKLRIQKDRDHRYIPNVISSAIVNTPPPEMLADTLNKRNKVHLFDPYTVEDMIPMFTHDVDGKKRNNKRLLPRRNWCSIREYHPGSTPPPTPPESSTPSDQMSQSEDYPPQTRRRFSFSREDANPRKLIRRLSQRGPPSSYRDDMIISSPIGGRRASHDGYFPNPQQPQTAPPTRTSFPMNNNGNPMQPQTAPPNRTSFNSTASYNQLASIDALPSAPPPRPGIFRRPTNLSEKAAKKGGAPPFSTDSHGNLVGDLNDHIDLEGGLDITLNCEVNQGDPAGITTPYRLLIPALRYDGSSDSQKLDAPTGNGAGAGGMRRKPTLLRKLGFGRTGNRSMADRQGDGNWGQASDSGSESLGGEAQYNGQHDDLYYEGEKRPLSGGGAGAGAGLKRWFSDRRSRKRQDERYSPDYEPQQQPQQSSLQQRARQLQTRTQTQLQDEFVGRELRTTPPQPPLQQHNQIRTTPTATKRTSATSYDDTPLPIEPFPSQARGKAARVMGVDQGPPLPVVPPYSRVNPHSQPQRQPLQPQGVAANANLTRTTSVNHSQPLARAATLPLPSPQDRDDGSARFYAGYELGRAGAQGQGQRGESARVAGVGAGAEQGQGEMVRGYSGVEAYREKRRGSAGGKLRKWF